MNGDIGNDVAVFVFEVDAIAEKITDGFAGALDVALVIIELDDHSAPDLAGARKDLRGLDMADGFDVCARLGDSAFGAQ